MLDPKIFEELNGKLSALIAASPARDIEKNVKAMLASVFEKMDLVTREEFDIQSQVLARTREKLKDLEARVDERLLRRRDRPDVRESVALLDVLLDLIARRLSGREDAKAERPDVHVNFGPIYDGSIDCGPIYIGSE